MTGPDGVIQSVRAFLGGVAVVDDLAAGRSLVAAHPEVIAVTKRGDVLGVRTASGGAGEEGERGSATCKRLDQRSALSSVFRLT